MGTTRNCVSEDVYKVHLASQRLLVRRAIPIVQARGFYLRGLQSSGESLWNLRVIIAFYFRRVYGKAMGR